MFFPFNALKTTTNLINFAEAATEFSISLLQTLAVEESKVISELHNLVDALAKVCACLAFHGKNTFMLMYRLVPYSF